MPVPVGLRLFLPDEWTRDAPRAARAGVPQTAMAPRSEGEIALAERDRLLAAGVRFGTVLADAGHGTRAGFRYGLDARGLSWALGIARNQKVYGVGVQLVPPPGRARRLVPDEELRPSDETLAALRRRRVTWRHEGSPCGPVRGDPRGRGRRACVGQQPPSAGQAGLAGRRGAHQRRAQIPPEQPGPRTSLRALAAAIEARWVCGQGHQQLKGELGLGHFEGRSWTGLHRHALMTCIAFACLQHLRLAEHRRTGRGKNASPFVGTAPTAQPAWRAPRHRSPAVRAPGKASPVSALQAQGPACA